MLCLDSHVPVFLSEDVSAVFLCQTLDRRHNVLWSEVVVPGSVSDVFLCHHPIPFALGNVVVVCRTEQ